MSTHAAVATTAVGVLERIDLPTPTPRPDEILIDARYAALNPFDGYQLNYGYTLQPGDYPQVLGVAGSGIVKAVGTDITDIREGDRVAVLNVGKKNKATQACYVVHRYQITTIPDSLRLEDAATIPDNYTTAMFTVFGTPNLAFPLPETLVPPSVAPGRKAADLSAPVLVYGAGASSGQYMVQAFRIAGCTSIFAVASSHHHDYLRTLGATACFDYRTPDVASQICAAASRSPAGHIATAVDVVASRASLAILAAVFAQTAGARLAVLAPFKDGETVTNGRDAEMHFTPPPWFTELFAEQKAAVEVLPILTIFVEQDVFSRDYIMSVLLPKLLQRGAIQPNAVRLMKDGNLVDRVRTGMELLSNNKISGEKVVIDLQE